MTYTFSDNFKELAPSAIREILKSASAPDIIAFSAGNPNAASFPLREMRQICGDIFEQSGAKALQYGATEGYTPLRLAVTERQRARFGVGRDFDDTLITSGGQQALELACRVLCNPGDTMLSEDPSFIGALNAFRGAGVRLAGVPLERDGMNLEALEKAMTENPRVRLLYTIPTFHNPTGITTSFAKRQGIYELAKKHGVLILEDNPYGELRFSGEDIPPIKALDEDGIVIYCSSFSKLLSAGMRVGFAIAPRPIVAKMTVCKQTEDVHSNLFFQILCHRFMTEHDFDGHIASIKALYGGKAALMTDAFDTYMPPSVSRTRPQGGLFLWCSLPESIDLPTFCAEALRRKVAVVPGTAFSVEQDSCRHDFRVTYATPTDEQLVQGMRILSEVIADM